jgi:hypothetical protein
MQRATEQDLKKRTRRNCYYKNSEKAAGRPAKRKTRTSEHQYGLLTAVTIKPPFTHARFNQHTRANPKQQRDAQANSAEISINNAKINKRRKVRCQNPNFIYI